MIRDEIETRVLPPTLDIGKREKNRKDVKKSFLQTVCQGKCANVRMSKRTCNEFYHGYMPDRRPTVGKSVIAESVKLARESTRAIALARVKHNCHGFLYRSAVLPRCLRRD